MSNSFHRDRLETVSTVSKATPTQWRLSFKISDYQSNLSGLDTIENVSKDLLTAIIDSDLVKDQQELTGLKNYDKKILKNRVKISYKQVDYNFGRVTPSCFIYLPFLSA